MYRTSLYSLVITALVLEDNIISLTCFKKQIINNPNKVVQVKNKDVSNAFLDGSKGVSVLGEVDCFDGIVKSEQKAFEVSSLLSLHKVIELVPFPLF